MYNSFGLSPIADLSSGGLLAVVVGGLFPAEVPDSRLVTNPLPLTFGTGLPSLVETKPRTRLVVAMTC